MGALGLVFCNVFRNYELCRNGQHGAHCWWSVSLDIRICAQEAAESAILLRRSFLCPGLADKFSCDLLCISAADHGFGKFGKSELCPYAVADEFVELCRYGPGYSRYAKLKYSQQLSCLWPSMLILTTANTVLFRKLPLIEGCIMVVHVFAFLAFIIVLWVMAPRSDTSVFTEFSSNGWSTTGLSFLVGITGPLAYLTGGDSAVHLGEEVKNSSYIIPRSMLVTAISNYVLSFVAVGAYQIYLLITTPS